MEGEATSDRTALMDRTHIEKNQSLTESCKKNDRGTASLSMDEKYNSSDDSIVEKIVPSSSLTSSQLTADTSDNPLDSESTLQITNSPNTKGAFSKLTRKSDTRHSKIREKAFREDSRRSRKNG